MSLYHTTHWVTQLLGAIRKEISVRKANDKQQPKVFVASDVYEALAKIIKEKFPVSLGTDDLGESFEALEVDSVLEQLMIDGSLVTEMKHLDDGLVMVVNGVYAAKFEEQWRKEDATQTTEVPERGVYGDSPVQGTEGNDEDV